jgi:hypothetical protein
MEKLLDAARVTVSTVCTSVGIQPLVCICCQICCNVALGTCCSDPCFELIHRSDSLAVHLIFHTDTKKQVQRPKFRRMRTQWAVRSYPLTTEIKI